jgi:hypothetical protein
MFCTDENTQRVPFCMNVEFEQHKKRTQQNRKKQPQNRIN